MTKLWKQIVLGFVAVLLVTVFGVGCGTENRRGPDSKTDLQSDIKSEVTSTVSGEKATYRQVSSDIAAEMMVTENNYVILDVRTQQEYEEGHIPGAICIPNETIGTEEIPSLPDKAQLILVYCRSGNRS
ncbi:MAG: rhodanese-like domain-containing protein, partial [Lachnospiraceae bacterium]|nr:rhodanese-like domain-containing protein [Lachnospiraceae bacterium]